MTIHGLKKLGPSKKEVKIGQNLRVLYSYETPVAIARDGVALITDEYHSRTTSKHINSWVAEFKGNTIKVSPDKLDLMISRGY
jgi:hypothetical protein